MGKSEGHSKLEVLVKRVSINDKKYSDTGRMHFVVVSLTWGGGQPSHTLTPQPLYDKSSTTETGLNKFSISCS